MLTPMSAFLAGALGTWTPMLYSVVLPLALMGSLANLPLSRATRAEVTGSYEFRTARGGGCWLQVAPIARDSVRIQLQCDRGAPSHNLAFIDARLPVQGRRVAYYTTEFGGRCQVQIRFAARVATVVQDGTDATCGFGAGVRVDGTYRRVSRRMPPFNLAPNGAG